MIHPVGNQAIEPEPEQARSFGIVIDRIGQPTQARLGRGTRALGTPCVVFGDDRHAAEALSLLAPARREALMEQRTRQMRRSVGSIYPAATAVKPGNSPQ